MSKMKFLYLILLGILTACTLHAEDDDLYDMARHHHSPVIHVVTMSIGEWYQHVTYPSYVNKSRYCEKHGYTFHSYTESMDTTRPIPWTKILAILEVMENNPECEWVFWTDADSLIMNDSVKLSRLIDPTYNMITASDYNGINTGQFLIKNCEWSKDFLKRVYAQDQFINHGWWEQMAIMHLYASNKRDKRQIKVLKQRTMNSYAKEAYDSNWGLYQEGDFIIHFAGVRGADLERLMNQYSNL